MNNHEIKNEIEKIFRDVFDDPDLLINEEMSSDDIPNWDSLNHVNLVGAIERHFGVRFALGELEELEDVGGVIRLVRKKMHSLK